MSRNVSASGIYFETDVPLRESANLTFTVDFTSPAGNPLRMACVARIVRVEDLGGRIGVGAKIEEFRMERMEEARA